MNRNAVISNTILHAEKLRSTIEQNTCPTKDDCRTVIEDINTLRGFPAEKKEMGEGNMNIEVLFEDFTQYVEISKIQLETMLALISIGRAPTKESVRELNTSIDSLREKYTSIYQAALEQLPVEEMPGVDAGAGEYVEAVRNSQVIHLKKRLEEAADCLKKFLSVRSLTDKYINALAPYQSEANELLRSLSLAGDTDIEQLEENIIAPRTLIAAIECADKDSEEELELCEKLDEFYPKRVSFGVAKSEYYIDTSALELLTGNADLNSSDVREDQAETQEEDSSQPAKGHADPADEAEKEPMEETNESNPTSDTDSKTTSDTNDTAQDSAFVTALKEKACLYSSDSEFGAIHAEVGQGESKKISSSIFKNEFKEGNIRAEKIIVQALVNRNFVSERYLRDVKGVPEEIASGSIAYMLKKGYLRKYQLPLLNEELYFGSPRLIKALTYMDACKFVEVKQQTVESWGTSVADMSANAASRIAASENYIDSACRLKERGAQQYSEYVSLWISAFCGIVYDSNKPSDCELFLGQFWTSEDECDAYLQFVQKTVAARSGITSVTISSYDLPHATAFADVILKELSDLPADTPVYLYALAEHEYYPYPLLAPIDSENASVEADSGNFAEDTYAEDTQDAASTDQTEQHGSDNENEDQLRTPETASGILDSQVSSSSSTVFIPVAVKAAPHCEAVYRTMVSAVPIEVVKENLYQMLCKKQFYAAAAYMKALCETSEDARRLYTQLAYALNDPMEHCIYSSSSAFDLITRQDAFEDYLVIATALRMFFSNQVRFDYTIKSFHSSIREYALLTRYPSLGSALYTLVDFKDTNKKGVDAYADYRAKSRTELEKEMLLLQKEAGIFYDNFVVGRKKEKCSQKRFLETKTLMFSVNSDFGIYLKIVADDNSEYVPLVIEFLQTHFYSQESIIAEDSYDGNLVWNYIQEMWGTAGDRMMYKRHADLKSRLRSNITNETVKAIQILAKWVSLHEQLSDHTDDAGTVQYKKIKKTLRDNLLDALTGITADIAKTEEYSEDAAGLRVLETTISDLLHCLDGSYHENTRKFFYIPFLLTDDVILGEDMTPDLDMHSSSLAVLRPDQRILMHIQKRQSAAKNYLDRLHEILDERGDDYGSAAQIAQYLSAASPETDLAEILSQIEAGEAFAKENAEISRTDFIGELELAQSYGQIDNSVEDRKEMILQIVNEWHEWANDTSNYGFFRKVMDAYLWDIKEASKSRGNDLQEQLEKLKTKPVPGISLEVYHARVKRIQEMIDAQNYTVAEDLLARASNLEDGTESYIEEDFLREFLDHYDDYYTPVAKHTANFATLVSGRTRNKEARGAKRLAENWLPGGSDLGKERLLNLLACFGFNIDTIMPQSRIGKFEHFFVRGKGNENGKRVVYTHPIAALGSGLSEDEVRVVCINGMYDADGLIDIMKNIGDAKHTIILIDTALSMSERRRLARKSKNTLGEKLFVVIDRTVMMFLLRNYDENKINRMLVSLVTPFGYYQPYVADSANVMPPEIFMGRKLELERIKSAAGVNIVYGGRQLGKSALLKKAKEDIDWNENSDRAVYIEVKELNYKEAARKIGHELYDKFILEEDIDTTDWDELARAVKRRLLSPTARKIPYLLLLIDEADAFIESCEAVNYRPFDALKDIQNIGTGRFKFVVAGLRNVVRFKREAALGNNSVLTHLQAMTVKPFSPSEARELLEIPLHYLGLRFSKEKESLITLILATTNYFPGLIQLYCTKLLEAMRNKDYAGYGEANTPLYEVSEGHIKKVLADPAFKKQIWDKFEITLKLDDDNYYYLIALLMAYLYHNNGYNAGYCVADVKDAAAVLSIDKISSLTESKLGALMEELRELNVLRNTDDTHYLFTRVAFFQMLGTSNEVEDKLMSYMEV